MTQDIAYSVYVVSAGWDDRLEELAALLGARFQMPTAAVMSALQAGEATVAETLDLPAASHVIEALARLSIVATVRPSATVARPAEQTLHVGWAQAVGLLPEQVLGRTMHGSPAQIVNQVNGTDRAAVVGAPSLQASAGLDSEVPAPWASALAPALSSSAGVARVNPARERAALLRGEGKGGQSAAPAITDPSRVSPAEPQGISAITRISSVNDELEQTVILADVSAQAVALLRETPPPSTARAGGEPSVGAWGAVLGKGVEAQLAVVASPSLPEPVAGQITPRLTDDPRFFAEPDDPPDLPAAPSQAPPKAFARLHSPDEARSVLPVASTSAASSKANTALRAALFSLLAPGAGQAYNNQQGRALTFALAGVLVVPWLLSIREAWVDASRGMKSSAAAAPNVKAAATLAFTFWLLVGLFGTFIWSIDRATTDSTSAVVSASPPAPARVFAPAPAASPLAVPRAEEPPMVRELAREASGEPSTARAELRERIAGLVARAQLACNSGEYVDCRQLAEQALALDETDPGAHRVHVVAIEGISGFQERSDEAGFNGPVIGSTPTPRPAVYAGDTVPRQPNPTSPSSVTPALPVAP